MSAFLNKMSLCIRVNTPSHIGVSLDGKTLLFSMPNLTGSFVVEGHDDRNILKNCKPFDYSYGITSNSVVIGHLQKKCDSWREDIVYKILDRDWYVHLASKTVYVSQSDTLSWGNWRKFTSPYNSDNNSDVIKLSIAEWKTVRNLYLCDFWVMTDGTFTEDSRRIRLHEIISL